MLTLTSPVETPLHRLPAGAKLAGLCLATVVLFRLDSPVPLGACLAMLAVLHLALGLRFASTALRLLVPLWPFVLVIAFWHLWLGEPAAGATILLRLVTAVAAANLVTMTTRLSDMVTVIEKIAAPLRRIGLSPRSLALAIALAIRFLPVLSQRMGQISEALRARSPRRAGYRVLIPACLAALDDAEHVAEALRARGGAG
ncbi:energy-coupling factor transporter transmembrane component T family protein [Paragemmobacter straminiformis]|uniref:Energy-coupling factor transporter transmembrane protein EcfT n=1 Tax=Paragemmobacter straminiformis TaxID=2045119 RepID=A0A842I3T9_9RHOB|nr:energy-coupling factor transporter transmembrane component T [Gemmobacter straminiformis]MBC2834346.1 energy-coupling factor transporter transmembrane protein EcfT [Gemmobacter straminiformis]